MIRDIDNRRELEFNTRHELAKVLMDEKEHHKFARFPIKKKVI